MKWILSLVLLLIFVTEIECKNARDRAEFKNKLNRALQDNDIEFNPNDKDVDEYCNFVEQYQTSKLDKYDADNKNELKQRFKIFKQNKDKIKNWNENARKEVIDGQLFYEHYGITQFADMTEDEKAAMFEQGSSTERRRMASIKQCDQVPSNEYDNVDINAEPFKSSYTRSKYCGHGENQGQTSGCWEFATAGQAQCNININSDLKQILFNEQFVTDCTTPEQGTKNGGGRISKGVEYMSTMGFCEKEDYPYHWETAGNRDLDGHCDCYGPKYYSKCELFDYQKDTNKLLKAGASHAWAFGMYIGEQFFSLKPDPNNPGGKLVYNSCKPFIDPETKQPAGHAMVIVGISAGEYLYVKNSWGSQWGDNGFVHIHADVFTGECHRNSMLARSHDFTPGLEVSWKQVLPQPSNGLTHVSIGSDSTIIGVDSDMKIWKYNGESWSPIPGGLKQISVRNANEFWGVNSADEIWKYNGESWSPIAGRLKHVSVASDGTVWGVNAADEIFRYGDDNTWSLLSGKLSQISVGSKNHIVGVNSIGEIWKLSVSSSQAPLINTPWTKIGTSSNTISDAGFKYVDISSSGEIFGIDTLDRIYQYKSERWILILPTYSRLKQMESYNGAIIGVNSNNNIWRGTYPTHGSAFRRRLIEDELNKMAQEN